MSTELGERETAQAEAKLTTKELELVTGLRQAMEKVLATQLNENVNNKITSALGTGIFQITSAAAESFIQDANKIEPE